jgi:hypothetical protein
MMRPLIFGATIGLLALAALALIYDVITGGGLGLTSAAPLPPGPEPIAIDIGGEHLAIPANWLRFADQRHGGAHPRADLALLLPSLDGITSANAPAFATTQKAGRLVFISIEPGGGELDTADRIATIYQRFLEPDEKDGPDGLVRRLFRAGTPYAGEELYFEPGSVHPFAARCYPEAPGEPPIACLRDLRLGKQLIATIRLPRAALPQWRDLSARLDKMLAGLTGG